MQYGSFFLRTKFYLILKDFTQNDDGARRKKTLEAFLRYCYPKPDQVFAFTYQPSWLKDAPDGHSIYDVRTGMCLLLCCTIAVKSLS